MSITFTLPGLTTLGLALISSLGCGRTCFADALVSAGTELFFCSTDEPSGSVSAYALVQGDRGERIQTRTCTGDLHGLNALKVRFGKDFLWFRQGRQEYVIRDEAALGKVRELFKPEEALDRQEEALDHQEEQLDARQEALEAKLEGLDERMEGLEEPDELEDAAEEAAARTRITAQRQSLDRERAPLDQELKALVPQIQKLAREQEALGRKQEVASREAERGLEKLIAEALRSGVAVRVEKDGAVVKR